ncbi:MAG: hypothetical protein RLZ95_1544 [Bacteroidota bacterium]|jgi:hypothetical protein
MSYIDKSKYEYMRLNQILEMENEMLRNQIRKLKIELNELLDTTKPKGEQANNEGND